MGLWVSGLGERVPVALVVVLQLCYRIGMPKPPSSVKSLRLPDATWEAVTVEAARRSVSVNALIATAVTKEIGQWSDEEVAAMRTKAHRALVINRIAPRTALGEALPARRIGHQKPGAKR